MIIYCDFIKLTIPTDRCTHEENRKKVCASCGTKISFGNKTFEHFRITKKNENLIKTLLNPDFNLNDSKFPLSICVTCCITLSEHEKENFKRPLPTMPNYADMHLPKATRFHGDTCNCFICLTGRSSSKKKIKKGRGQVRTFSIQIDKSNGIHGGSAVTSLPPQRNVIEEPTNLFIMCKICYQEISRGKPHNCGTPTKARENVMKLVESLPEKQQEQVISSVLKRKRQDNSLSGGNVNDVKNCEVQLSTEGSKLRVSVNPKKFKPTTFDVESLDNFQVNTGASRNQMRKLTNFLRCNVGRKSIPPHYERHMTENLNTFDNVYQVDLFDFDTDGNGSMEEKRPVVWADAEKLVEFVIEKRNSIGNVNLKLMADGGKGFFKISLSIFLDSCKSEPNYESKNSDFESDLKSSKRNLYSDGGTTGRKSLLTSVNRLIMLCVVPQIKETYSNIELLFKLTNINNIPFKFVSDFKVLLIVNGQQTATASFPCPYCFIALKYLRDRKDLNNYLVQDDSTSNDDTDQTAAYTPTLKTYGDLRNDYNTFCSLGNDKKLAKNCHSTVNPPLLDEANDTYIIQKCIIPELHIMQGYVNHLFWDGLVHLVGRKKALLWPLKLKLVPKNYQGDIFEGNACRSLLKEADKLLDPEIYENLGPLRLVPFVTAFKAMDRIVNLYFSVRAIRFDDELEKHIRVLHKAFEATGVSETLKIHVVLKRMEQCLQFLDGSG